MVTQRAVFGCSNVKIGYSDLYLSAQSYENILIINILIHKYRCKSALFCQFLCYVNNRLAKNPLFANLFYCNLTDCFYFVCSPLTPQ